MDAGGRLTRRTYTRLYWLLVAAAFPVLNVALLFWLADSVALAIVLLALETLALAFAARMNRMNLWVRRTITGIGVVFALSWVYFYAAVLVVIMVNGPIT